MQREIGGGGAVTVLAVGRSLPSSPEHGNTPPKNMFEDNGKTTNLVVSKQNYLVVFLQLSPLLRKQMLDFKYHINIS